MKSLPLIVTIVVFFLKSASGQDSLGRDSVILEGAYRNPADFLNQKLLFKNDFYTTRVNNQKAFPFSYNIKSNNIKVGENDIKFGIWAIYDDGYLYINALRHTLREGYIKVRYTGNYCYLYGFPMLNTAEMARLNKSHFSFGLIGRGITGAKINKTNRGKRHHVLNIKKGTTSLLTRAYIERILKEDEGLHKEFLQDLNSDSIRIFREYLYKINERNLSFE